MRLGNVGKASPMWHGTRGYHARTLDLIRTPWHRISFHHSLISAPSAAFSMLSIVSSTLTYSPHSLRTASLPRAAIRMADATAEG